MSRRWHKIVEDAVDRNPVPAVLVVIGDPDTETPITITPIQYQERAEPVAGLVQQSRRWMIPAARLAAAGFVGSPVSGNILRVPSLGIEARVSIVGPGFAGGEVVRWDITEEGVS